MGRAEKYKDVLKKYEEEEKKKKDQVKKRSKKKEKEIEEKLSLTRELKFKELQEEIDKSVTIEEVEDLENIMNDTKEIKDPLEEDDIKPESDIEVEEVGISFLDDNDDIEIEDVPFIEETNELSFDDTIEIEDTNTENELDEDTFELELPEDDEDEEIEVTEEPEEIDVDEAPEITVTKERPVVTDTSKEEKKKIDDDLYLTTSFAPLRKRFKVSKLFKVLIILALLAGAIFALFFFVLKPLKNTIDNSAPRKVFENTIDNVAEYINNIYDNYGIDLDNIYFDLELNEKDSTDILGYELNLNRKDNNYYSNIYIKDTNTYGNTMIVKEDKTYQKFSNNISYLEGSTSTNTSEYYENLNDLIKYVDNNTKNITYSDFKYLINKNQEVIKSLFEDEMFKSSSDELDIGGKTYKVRKNTLALDKDKLSEVTKKYSELILEDSEYIRIYATYYDLTTEKAEEYFKNLSDSFSDDYTLKFNIYTLANNKVVGFDIEEDGFRKTYIYLNDSNIIAHFNISNTEDNKVNNEVVIDINSKTEDDISNITISYNNEEIIKLKVKEMNENKIDSSFDIKMNKDNVTGNILINRDKENKKDNITLDIDNSSTYNININYNIPSDLYNISSDNIEYNKIILSQYEDEFVSTFTSDETKDVYNNWYKMVSGTNLLSLFKGEE